MSATDAVVEALLKARQTGAPADAAPLAHALVSPDDAYLVQQAVANELGWLDAGVPRHWKSGGASRSATLMHAALPDEGIWASPAALGTWPFRLRYIEAEVALRLGRDVDAALAATLDHGAAATLVDAMTVSIEVVDSRWQQGLEAPVQLRLADLLSHGGLVLGDWVPYAARDWAAQPCRVQIGSGVHEFVGTHSLQDPAFVLRDWLRHATAEGGTVTAGTVVTTGTWCGALEAQRADAVSVQFAGIGEARLQF